MKIINLTHSPCWFDDHFKHLLVQTGHTGETLYRSEANFSADKANKIWRELKDYFESFDAVLVSHTASWSRVFLQNNWTKPLYIWFFFRFDHDVPDREEYYALLKTASSLPNVRIFAATETDKIYAERKLHFSIPVIKPFICINNEPKTSIPCGEDAFYLIGKHNESLLADKLRELGVPIYRQDWTASVPDLRSVRGIVHFPYVFATRSFIENLALGNVYFLPTERLLNEFRGDPNYFWDGTLVEDHLEGKYSLTEWYQYDKLFVYFDSFEQLRDIHLSGIWKAAVFEKKILIQEFVERQNEKALREWADLLR